MEAHELVELAAILSWNAPAFVAGCPRISPSSLEQYWSASKCRMDRWAATLKRYSAAHNTTGTADSRRSTPAPIGAMEEILAGEVLTRIWAALLAAVEQHHGGDEASPISHSVLIGHMESRNRVLGLIADGAMLCPEEAVRLNRLRRRVERWVDLLISRIATLADVTRMACDPRRARELADELTSGHVQTWPVLLASLRAAFRTSLTAPSPNRDLNARIASSILACMHGDLFVSTGLPRSVWITRLLNAADDTQGLLDELFRLEESGLNASRDSIPSQAEAHTPDSPGFIRRRPQS